MSASDSAARPMPARRGNSLGFIRLFLAALVIYNHAHVLGGFPQEFLFRWTDGRIFTGSLAVQAFFVLSGGLITTSWLRVNSGVRFAAHRVLRIFPACWMCLAITALVFGPLIYFTSVAPPATGYFAQDPSPGGYIGHNLFVPHRQIAIGRLIVDNPWSTEFNGSLWTLFYEMSCYAGVLAAGWFGLLRRGRRLWLGLWMLLLVGYAWTLYGQAPHLVIRWYDTPGKEHCLHFASGMAWALFPEWTRPLLRRAWPAALAAGLLIASWFFGRGVIVSALTLPVVLFYLGEHLSFRDWERKLRGDYSYGIYLYGYPVQQTLAHFALYRLGFIPWLVLGLVVAGGCGYLSWHAIEAPALRLKDRFRSPAGTAVSPV